MNRIDADGYMGILMDRVLVDQIATLYPEHSWLAEIGVLCSFG